LEKISKQEMNFLIQKNIFQLRYGNYGDSLVVTGKFSSKVKKQRFATPFVYDNLLRLKKQEKMGININNIKSNQKYLFE